MKTYDRLFIGNEWVQPSSASTFDVVSPTTEEVVGRVPEAQNADIDRAVATARQAFDHGPWPRMTPAERGAILSKVAEAIRNDMPGLTELIANEMGSPVSWGQLAQVLAPSMILDYYAGMAATYAFDTVRDGLLGPVIIAREPVGVVAAITPWNVPLFLAAAKLGPALLSGSTVVFKPAPETPLDANVLAELFRDAGLPDGVLSVVPAGREVGEYLVNHPGVDKVSFTGSTAAGRKIGAACGANLKRCSLELGGKSAAIVLDDANLAESLPLMLPNAIMNNGEACISLTRILAPRDRYAEVTEGLVELVAAMKVGDALDPATEVGPLVAERQRERVEGYIRIGQEEGAKVALGGGRPAASTEGGSSSRRSSSMSTTACGSPRRRSSGPCCPSSPTTAMTRPCGSPTTRTTDCAGRCSRVTTTEGSRWLAASGPGPTWSTPTCPSTSRPPSAATRPPGWGASSGRTASSCSSRRRPSTSRPATARRCDHDRPGRPVGCGP